jgi:hypothetical protein
MGNFEEKNLIMMYVIPVQNFRLYTYTSYFSGVTPNETLASL